MKNSTPLTLYHIVSHPRQEISYSKHTYPILHCTKCQLQHISSYHYKISVRSFQIQCHRFLFHHVYSAIHSNMLYKTCITSVCSHIFHPAFQIFFSISGFFFFEFVAWRCSFNFTKVYLLVTGT